MAELEHHAGHGHEAGVGWWQIRLFPIFVVDLSASVDSLSDVDDA